MNVHELETTIDEQESRVYEQHRLHQVTEQLHQHATLLDECCQRMQQFEPEFQRWSAELLVEEERIPAQHVSLEDLEEFYRAVGDCMQVFESGPGVVSDEVFVINLSASYFELLKIIIVKLI